MVLSIGINMKLFLPQFTPIFFGARFNVLNNGERSRTIMAAKAWQPVLSGAEGSHSCTFGLLLSKENIHAKY